MARIVQVLNGPNLNLLGQRQPQIYGHATLADVEALCRKQGAKHDFEISFHQSNDEGALVELVHVARQEAAGIIINPAGYTTTSIALLDALLTFDSPIVEIHITNIHKREEFRQHSYVSKAATGVICGLGVQGYALALDAMAGFLSNGH